MTMTEFNLPSTSAELSVSSYMQQVKKFPVLSQEEESSLVNSWLESNDLEAAHKLVTSHLRLVVKMA